ncbi:hypothetical protein N8469_00545 [bacterium]|jgi:hypothetical protein|nr:hypothetical protein [bacterium]
MGNSGIEWVDNVFDFCVIILVRMAEMLGISYEEINIWLFVVIQPAITILLFLEILRLKFKIKGNSHG